MRTQSSLFATTSASRSLAILCLLVQHCTSFLTPFTPQKLSLLSPNVGAHSRVRRGPGIAALASRRLIVTKEDRCFYKELGVKRGAKNEDIRKAFLLLAKKHHPDVSQDPDSLQRCFLPPTPPSPHITPPPSLVSIFLSVTTMANLPTILSVLTLIRSQHLRSHSLLAGSKRYRGHTRCSRILKQGRNMTP